jgi:beta-lactamase class A
VAIGSRRAKLAALLMSAALALAGCSTGARVAEPTVSPTGSARAQLDSALGVVLSGYDKSGVALLDLGSGAEYGLRADYASQSASMAKPMLVAMALRKARPGALPSDMDQAARKAITESDNDSADALWAYAGKSAAYDALAKELGLASTHADASRDWWSWTWTTPADQVALLGHLVKHDSPALTQAECDYILDLMSQVRDDQAWGVGSPRSEGAKAWLKNGWVQFESTDGLWAVNSMGRVQGGGRDYLLAVMTRVPDFDTGKALTSAVGKWVFDVLGSGPLQ